MLCIYIAKITSLLSLQSHVLLMEELTVPAGLLASDVDRCWRGEPGSAFRDKDNEGALPGWNDNVIAWLRISCKAVIGWETARRDRYCVQAPSENIVTLWTSLLFTVCLGHGNLGMWRDFFPESHIRLMILMLLKVLGKGSVTLTALILFPKPNLLCWFKI